MFLGTICIPLVRTAVIRWSTVSISARTTITAEQQHISILLMILSVLCSKRTPTSVKFFQCRRAWEARWSVLICVPMAFANLNIFVSLYPVSFNPRSLFNTLWITFVSFNNGQFILYIRLFCRICSIYKYVAQLPCKYLNGHHYSWAAISHFRYLRVVLIWIPLGVLSLQLWTAMTCTFRMVPPVGSITVRTIIRLFYLPITWLPSPMDTEASTFIYRPPVNHCSISLCQVWTIVGHVFSINICTSHRLQVFDDSTWRKVQQPRLLFSYLASPVSNSFSMHQVDFTWRKTIFQTTILLSLPWTEPC